MVDLTIFRRAEWVATEPLSVAALIELASCSSFWIITMGSLATFPLNLAAFCTDSSLATITNVVVR